MTLIWCPPHRISPAFIAGVHTTSGSRSVLPPFDSARFSRYHSNARFIQLNASFNASSFDAKMFLSLSDNNSGHKSINPTLCHIKTELVVACLMAFLHPYGTMQCRWTAILNDVVWQLIDENHAEPLFAENYSSMLPLSYRRRDTTKRSDNWQALLLLSSASAGLIRHENTCFLQSLCVILQITSKQLLVLVDKIS